MKISYNWLQSLLKFDINPEQLSELLTHCGLEVEGIEKFETVKGSYQGLKVGHVLTKVKHPGADKLNLTTVDIGNGVILPVVCGAPNVEEDQKVIIATVGTTVYPTDGEPFTITKAKIRGEVSEGMLCGGSEIGMQSDIDGLVILDQNLQPGTLISDIFKVEIDYIFEIGLTPNRADAASHIGVARDIKALIVSKKLDIEKNQIVLPDLNFQSNGSLPLSINILNTEKCIRYTGVVIKDIKVSSSPLWLQNRLKSIGVKSINNIVDITNYVLHALGQPLHAFDLSKIDKNELYIGTIEVENELKTLDNQVQKINSDDLLIYTHNQKPLCIAGVIGGFDSGVSSETTSIFLESACFQPDTVRKTSQKMGIKTDSSFRFERGTDPNLPLIALQFAAKMILDLAGGNASETQDWYPSKVEEVKIEVKFTDIKRLLGIEIERSEVFSILKSLDIDTINQDQDIFIAIVPTYKVEVLHTADICEEIIRMIGFERIELQPYLGSSYLAPKPSVDQHFIRNNIANWLAGNGFYEMTNNSLTKQSYPSLEIDQRVNLLNSLSEDLGCLRQTLLFGGLEAVAYNVNRKQNNVKFFEIGKTYHKIVNTGEQKDYTEKEFLAIFISGNQNEEIWSQKSNSVSFYDAKIIATSVANQLNLKDIKLIQSENSFLSESVSIIQKNEIIGLIGKVNKSIAKQIGVKQDVWYIEFGLDRILKKKAKTVLYQEVSKFPEVRRDLSLVVEKNVIFTQIEDIARKTEKKLLKDISVFDVYQGDKIAQDKKAYSVSFTLIDHEKTLVDSDIEKVMSKLQKAFETEIGAVIRG